MLRFIERLEDYNKAFLRLKQGLEEYDGSEISCDGILKRFEFTFELAWKTLKDYLTYNGFDIKTGSPREILQISFKEGVIKDGNEWIDMMLSRNEVSHIYDYEVSRKIYELVKNKYIKYLEELNNQFIKIKEDIK